MRGINYLAALGTILIALAFYCLKAAIQKQPSTHGSKTKPSTKITFFVVGIAAALLGIFLMVKAIREI